MTRAVTTATGGVMLISAAALQVVWDGHAWTLVILIVFGMMAMLTGFGERRETR